jgi:hypothetical protein
MGVISMSLGEPNIKRALDWILAQLRDQPTAKRSALIDQAAREFDLTPLDEEFLQRQLVDELKKKGSGRPAS